MSEYITEFDEIPPLSAVLKRRNISGVEYGYILAENTAKARLEGWRFIQDSLPFAIKGQQFLLMESGEPVVGGSVSRAKVWIDNSFKETADASSQPSEPTSAQNIAREQGGNQPVQAVRQDRKGEAGPPGEVA